MDGELRFALPLEESVVEFLVVNVNLSHLGTNLLSHFGLHGLGVFLSTTRRNRCLYNVMLQQKPKDKITGCLSAFTFSCRASLISWIPVLLMNSGSSNGGFSIPLLPCRYFLLKHQWRGTGTVFLVAFRWTRSLGSCAVTSCISTTSGRATS